MKYAKYIDGQLVIKDHIKFIKLDGNVYVNPPKEIALKDGWKVLVEQEKPTFDEETQELEQKITEVEDTINVYWLIKDKETKLVENDEAGDTTCMTLNIDD